MTQCPSCYSGFDTCFGFEPEPLKCVVCGYIWPVPSKPDPDPGDVDAKQRRERDANLGSVFGDV